MSTIAVVGIMPSPSPVLTFNKMYPHPRDGVIAVILPNGCHCKNSRLACLAGARWDQACWWLNTHLFNSILLASYLSHLADALNMVLKVHLEAAGKGQVGFGPDIDVDLIGQYLPMPVPHTRVAQSLDQWDVRLELLYTRPDVQSHILASCGVGGRAC